MLNKHPDLWTHKPLRRRDKNNQQIPKPTILTSKTSPTKALMAVSKTISKSHGYQERKEKKSLRQPRGRVH
eukprot:693519-Pelagomonas_calceolata.AAC.1